MKTKILLVLAILVIGIGTTKAQISVGVRDNKYVFAEYAWRNEYRVKVEESLYSKKIGKQYIRGYVGSYGKHKIADYGIDLYAGTAYNGDYYTVGLLVQTDFHLLKAVTLTGILNPLYDSELDYLTCFEVMPQVKLSKDISILAGYSTIPEYRDEEKRIKAGFKFTSGAIDVTPYVIYPVEGDKETRSIKVRVSMKYSF